MLLHMACMTQATDTPVQLYLAGRGERHREHDVDQHAQRPRVHGARLEPVWNQLRSEHWRIAAAMITLKNTYDARQSPHVATSGTHLICPKPLGFQTNMTPVAVRPACTSMV